MQFKEESISILSKHLLKVPSRIIYNSSATLKVNTITNSNLISERRYSRHLSMSFISKITLIYQFMVFQIELEIMQPPKRISKKVLKLTQMSNLDLKKKIFMKREFSQLICKLKQIVMCQRLQLILLMKSMLLTRKSEPLGPILCSREKLETKRVSSRTSTSKV